MSVPVFLFPYMRGLIVQLLPALEFVTQGVVRATSHRVLAPPLDSKTPRYSVPFFFSGMDLETRVDENVLTSEYTIFQWSLILMLMLIVPTLLVPAEILKLRDERGPLPVTEC